MSWIKRNLYFFVGGVVAVLLLGLAGFYLYLKWEEDNQALTKLNELYAEMSRLNGENPHPGAGETDNIKLAKEQQAQLRGFMQKCRVWYQKAPAIPPSPKVSGQEFTTALRSTIAQLQRDATNASVSLPADYSFSFSVQRPRVTFTGSLDPLAGQLGEVKAICDVLFQAKINSLDNLRRERVTADDMNGPQTDYLDKKSITNELAILSPYELSFHCFSSELAAVLSGIAGSPCAMRVKTVNVEPASAATTDPNAMAAGMPAPLVAPPVYIPQPRLPMPMPMEGGGRYIDGGFPGGQGGPAGGIPLRPIGQGVPQPTYAPQPGAGSAAPAAAKGGLPTVLDEKQLRITVMLDVVKLLPATTK